jgi:hypothetical protein
MRGFNLLLYFQWIQFWTVIPNTQNHWVFGLRPSPYILWTRKHNVSLSKGCGRHLLSWVPYKELTPPRPHLTWWRKHIQLSKCCAAGSCNLLDLIFSNLSDLGITPVDPGLIKPNNYHPPPLWLSIFICPLPLVFRITNIYSYRKFSSPDYALLYNDLSTFDWSCVYDTTNVDSAVAYLNATVQDTMEHAIPRDIISSNSKSPRGYSSSLKVSFFPLWLYSSIWALVAIMKLFVSLQLLYLGLVGLVISSLQGL